MEQWIQKNTVYSGKIVSLYTGPVRIDDGSEAYREVVSHPGGVGVLPVLDDEVVLVRQFRIAVECDVLEIPAGKLEGDEDPEVRGRLELEEETGYRAGRMVSAGEVYATPGYCNELIRLYLAHDLDFIGQRLEKDERIELVRLSRAQILDGLKRHQFRDAKTVVALHAWLNE